jgi:hypothetical protein
MKGNMKGNDDMLTTSTLRPGLLVSVKTSKIGNVSYRKQTIEAEHTTDDGARRAKWETERKVADPAEDAKATEVRGKCWSLLAGVCARSAFGLLCPEDKAGVLETVIAEARARVDAFNAEARITRLGFFVLTGRIAPDDVEAVRAINGEIRGLLDAMREGVANLDATMIREAADKARSVGQILNPGAQERIADAIRAARSAARVIMKAGVRAAGEVDRVALQRIAEARTAFDLGEAQEVAAPVAVGRSIDFEADGGPVFKAAAPQAAPQISFEL